MSWDGPFSPPKSPLYVRGFGPPSNKNLHGSLGQPQHPNGITIGSAASVGLTVTVVTDRPTERQNDRQTDRLSYIPSVAIGGGRIYVVLRRGLIIISIPHVAHMHMHRTVKILAQKIVNHIDLVLFN